MSAPYNENEFIDDPLGDGLEGFEPVEPPRARLRDLGLLLMWPALVLFLPYDPDRLWLTLLGKALRAGSGGSGLRILYLFPPFAALLGARMAFALANALVITIRPKENSALGTLSFALSTVWIAAVFYLVVKGHIELRNREEDILVLGVIPGVVMLLSSALVPLPVGRDLLMVAGTSGVCFALFVWHAVARPWAFWFTWLHPVMALLAMLLALWCLRPYVRQKHVEREFRRCMRERERE